jgi:hypothetical protein
LTDITLVNDSVLLVPSHDHMFTWLTPLAFTSVIASSWRKSSFCSRSTEPWSGFDPFIHVMGIMQVRGACVFGFEQHCWELSYYGWNTPRIHVKLDDPICRWLKGYIFNML